jgi:hypothetical protein
MQDRIIWFWYTPQVFWSNRLDISEHSRNARSRSDVIAASAGTACARAAWPGGVAARFFAASAGEAAADGRARRDGRRRSTCHR